MAEARGRTLRHGRRGSREEHEIEFSRIVAFSDGVFAIAITLLVLTINVPNDSPDLWGELKDQGAEFFAYAISFAVLGRLWMVHHQLFAILREFDGTLIALNLLLLAFVALVPFSTDLFSVNEGSRLAVGIYAANMAVVGAVNAGMRTYGIRRDLARPEDHEALALHAGPANFVMPAVFLATIPIAHLSINVAAAIWVAIFVFGPRISEAIAKRTRRSRR